MGPGAHVIAVCQPCVQTLAAVAIMAEDDNPAQPASMTLMAGPIDTRVSPTKVNELAMGKPMSWFEQNLIHRVPMRYAGATRRVYPGFIQLTAFMSMNAERHIKAQTDLYRHLAKGETEQAKTIKDFYDEYFAVLDLTAEFYLETVQWVFQEHRLPRGELDWKGRRVNPKAIRRTALFTIEGERDPIARSTTCRPASAIMACSAAAAGRTRSTPWCETRFWPTNKRVFWGPEIRSTLRAWPIFRRRPSPTGKNSQRRSCATARSMT
jgi:polyhydroxyalkanoate depolymerase